MSSDLQRRLDSLREKSRVPVRRALDPATYLPVPQERKLSLIDKLRLVLAIKKLWSLINAEKHMKKLSWKTTVGGIVTAVGGALGTNENPILNLIGHICVIVGPLIMGVSARDVNVTSEQAGAKN